MQKKRILIFSTAYVPFVGGAEVAIREITDRIGEYEFVMITAKMDRKLPSVETVGNIEVHRIGWGIPMLDKLFLALFGHVYALRLHTRRPVSMIWSMMASYSGFAALSMKNKTGLPFLLTLQEGDPIEYIMRRVRFVKKRFVKIFTQADGLQAISTYLLHWGEQMGFAGIVKEVVPNGVDVERFTKEYSPSEIEELRKSFGFPENAVILVTASRLVVKNGIVHVIRALKDLPENVCFVICGTGELEHDLKDMTQELGLASRVVFAGNKSHAELPKVLKACDIFIRPSLSEGLGNAFLEAMAAGLPTIGTMVGGIPDFLEDGKTGFACKPGDPASIVQVVNTITRGSVCAKEQMYERAMKRIEEQYNWPSICEEMNSIFKTLVP